MINHDSQISVERGSGDIREMSLNGLFSPVQGVKYEQCYTFSDADSSIKALNEIRHKSTHHLCSHNNIAPLGHKCL